MKEENVLRTNGILDSVKALPFSSVYFAPETDKLNLLAEKRIFSSYNKFCDKLSVNGVDHIEEYASHLQSVEKGFAIFFIIFCSIMLVIGIAFALLFFLKNLSKNPTKVLYILFIILIVLCFILLIVYLVKVKTLENSSSVYAEY